MDKVEGRQSARDAREESGRVRGGRGTDDAEGRDLHDDVEPHDWVGEGLDHLLLLELLVLHTELVRPQSLAGRRKASRRRSDHLEKR